MERALTLFSLEMDICRFVQHGGGAVFYDRVDWRRVDFFFFFYFTYLFIYLFLFK